MTTNNPLSLQRLFDPEDFMPATNEEKESLVVMRESVGFWRDGARRLRKNKVAMTCLMVIIIIMHYIIFSVLMNCTRKKRFFLISY